MTTVFNNLLSCPYHGYLPSEEGGWAQVGLNVLSYVPYCHVVTGCVNIFQGLVIDNIRGPNWERDATQLVFRGVITLLGGKSLCHVLDIGRTAYQIFIASQEITPLSVYQKEN